MRSFTQFGRYHQHDTPVSKPMARMSRGRQRFLGFVALLLQSAQIANILGLLINIPSKRMVTTLTTLLCVLYLIANAQETRRIFLSRPAVHWLGVLIIAPLLLMYAQLVIGRTTLGDLYDWVFRDILIVILFMNAVVFAYNEGQRAVLVLMIATILLIWLGFTIQVIDFDFIRTQLRFRSVVISDLSVQYRAIGFFGHPNRFAYAILTYSTILIFFQLNSGRFWLAFMFSCFEGLAILLAGSRTSLMLFFIVTLIVLSNYLLRSVHVQQFLQRSIAAFGLTLLTITAVLALVALSGNLGSASLDLGIERIGRLLGSSTDDMIDQSGVMRKVNLVWFMNEAAKHPLLGLGPQATASAIRQGFVSNVSQNSWVQWIYEYGLLYPIYIIYASAIVLNLGKRMRGNSNAPQILKVLIFMIFLATFSINNIFVVETTAIGLALTFGLLLADLNRVRISIDDHNYSEMDTMGHVTQQKESQQ